MNASFRTFAGGLIDYAGIFPPARLPLDTAVQNYIRYLNDPDGWILSRFICPAARLEELGLQIAGLSEGALPFRLSILVGGGEADRFLPALEEDLDGIVRFAAGYGDRVEIGLLETKLPGGVSDAEHWSDWIAKSCSRVAFHAPPGTGLYFELPTSLIGTDAARRAFRTIAAQTRVPAGVKIRCGGENAAAVPQPEPVASAITICRDHGVRLKATAGLHQPIRHFDEALRTKMHGFVNLFVAALLARACRLDESNIRAVLEEEEPTAFRFDETGIQWREHRITVDQIETFRGTAATSFGSCSFDEPVEGLRALGLLEENGRTQRR